MAKGRPTKGIGTAGPKLLKTLKLFMINTFVILIVK